MNALRSDRGLSVPDLNCDYLLIFRKSKERHEKWETQILEGYSTKIIDVFEASKRQCKLVLALSLYDFEELVQINPRAGSCYILSTSEPFNEEMEVDFRKLTNWLDHYGLPQYHVHVSGHVMPLQLKALLKEMEATKIFPIHTENAELVGKFIRDLKGNVVLVEKGKEYGV